MRLRGIDAVRFGRLENISLRTLGDGLTIVLGPNGAGKTSFTTLVRHVLYGFPTKRDAERSYESSAGKRLGRLEFADGDDSWIIERTEGVRGGSLAVTAASGPERPDLKDRIVRGVSGNEFRVVFGFGLDDMPDIEPGRGSGDVLSRFYAAQVGLSVSPQDVRRALESDATAIYKPRGSTPEANALLAEIKAANKRIRELEDAAARFSEERARLGMLKEDASAARVVREQTALNRSELEGYLSRLESAEERRAEIDASMREQRSDLEHVESELASTKVDEQLVESAPVLGALLDEVSGFRERLTLMRKVETRAAEASATANRVLEAAGIDAAIAESIDSGPETRTTVERYRDQLSRAEQHAESAKRTMDGAADRVGASERVRQAPAPNASSGIPIAAVIMLALGLVSIAAGALLREWVSVGVGGTMAAIGAVLLISGSRKLEPGTEPLLTDPVAAHTLDLARLEFERAESSLGELQADWTTWSSERGLQASAPSPAAAVLVLSSVHEWRKSVAEHVAASRELTEIRAWCEGFRNRLAAVAGPHGSALAAANLDEVASHAARLRELLERAREASAEHARLAQRVGDLTRALERLSTELQQVSQTRSEVLERAGESAGSVDRLRVLVQTAGSEASQADAAFLELTAEVNRLEGELNNDGRDTELATLRLEITGLRERLAGAVERYSTLAVATRLLAKTQAYYEESRQPEVVKRAGQVFASITGGLYERIAIPAGATEIVAYRDSEGVPTSRLNRGAQEQLYLALRIALVEQLDEVGEGLPVLMDDIFANFDPAAHAGAVKAVTELARHRQVVFFTCHPEVVASFMAADPGATRLELERC